jgi:hypothetical protein
MALLTEKQRKKRFKYLGLGNYTKKNILKFQKIAFPNDKSEWDSKWGSHSDNALRTFYNVKKYAPSFKPQEFRCNCGHCCGYPSYMKLVELKHIQRIRNHYNKPMTITSGLRCSHENSRVGGVPNSGHLKGYAVDFYIEGVTDNLEGRKKALKWIVKQDNHEFTYGKDMVDSNGLYREAAGMGNAMHTETHKPPILSTVQKICAKAKAIAASGKYTYVNYNAKYGKECALCHPHKGKNKGWQCIGYPIASWHHGGGLACKCRCDVFTNQIYEKMVYGASITEARKIAQERLGLKKIKLIRNKSGIDPSKIEPGDILVYFKSKKYVHTALGTENHKIADCTSGRVPHIKYGVPPYKKWTLKLIIRYTGE